MTQRAGTGRARAVLWEHRETHSTHQMCTEPSLGIFPHPCSAPTPNPEPKGWDPTTSPDTRHCIPPGPACLSPFVYLLTVCQGTVPSEGGRNSHHHLSHPGSSQNATAQPRASAIASTPNGDCAQNAQDGARAEQMMLEAELAQAELPLSARGHEGRKWAQAATIWDPSCRTLEFIAVLGFRGAG